MGRKRFITDSYPVVKKREGLPGHSKGELAPELGEDTQSLSQEEAELELLRQFDLAWQYGPCTGISRMQRWHRAEQMGLKPPLEVHQVLKAHPEDSRFQYSYQELQDRSMASRFRSAQLWRNSRLLTLLTLLRPCVAEAEHLKGLIMTTRRYTCYACTAWHKARCRQMRIKEFTTAYNKVH